MIYFLVWLIGVPVFFFVIGLQTKFKESELPAAFILAFFWPIVLLIKIAISLLEL